MSNKVKNGHTVTLHYQGTFEDGKEFDSSFKTDKPVSFDVGSGTAIPGLEVALQGMEIGETKSVVLAPRVAYGEYIPGAMTEVPRASLPEGFKLTEGLALQARNAEGQKVLGTVKMIKEETILVDLNHPLAGKTLHFKIEVVDIK
jgi:peptidylprolyl isomerase